MISKNDEYVKMVLKVFKALTQHILHKTLDILLLWRPFTLDDNGKVINSKCKTDKQGVLAYNVSRPPSKSSH